MGGINSGGHNRLSEEERARKGTFRPDRSDEARAKMLGAKVLAHPRIREMPDPTLPLNDVGTRKFRELVTALLQADKLTQLSLDAATAAAVCWQSMHKKLEKTGTAPQSLLEQFNRAIGRLQLVEEAANIAPPSKDSRFRRCGFAARAAAPTKDRLRSLAGAAA